MKYPFFKNNLSKVHSKNIWRTVRSQPFNHLSMAMPQPSGLWRLEGSLGYEVQSLVTAWGVEAREMVIWWRQMEVSPSKKCDFMVIWNIICLLFRFFVCNRFFSSQTCGQYWLRLALFCWKTLEAKKNCWSRRWFSWSQGWTTINHSQQFTRGFIQTGNRQHLDYLGFASQVRSV